MKFNHLAVIIPVKWLPQNTEEARTQAWAAVTNLLISDLGKFYSRFYPATNPWGQMIVYPFGVVLGREDPVAFLNLFYQAKKKQEEAIAFHSIEMMSNINPEQTYRIGDTMFCHITADKSNPALTGHMLWHTAVTLGTLMPDCGVYYLEQKKAIPGSEQEKAVSGHPADYAMCVVTLEAKEEQYDT